MKKEVALKRISKEVLKVCPNEPLRARVYIEEVVYMFFESLENENTRGEYTSTRNLKYAIDVNLHDLFDELLEEAKREA